MKKVVIINGIRGIGRSISFKFIEEKWKTVVVYDKGLKYARDIRKLSGIIGNKARVLKMDIRRRIYWTRISYEIKTSRAILFLISNKEINKFRFFIDSIIDAINIIKMYNKKIRIIFILERNKEEDLKYKVIISSIKIISKELNNVVYEYSDEKDRMAIIDDIFKIFN